MVIASYISVSSLGRCGFWTYAFKPNIPEVLFMQTSYAATVTKIEDLLVDDGLSMDFAKHRLFLGGAQRDENSNSTPC